MSAGRTSWPWHSFFTMLTIFCASTGFVCEDPSDRSYPSGTSTNAIGTAGTGQSNPIGALRALGGHERLDPAREHPLEEGLSEPGGVRLAGDDRRRQLLLIADEDNLRAALRERHDRRGLRRLRRFVDEARLEGEPLEDVRPRARARRANHVRASKHAVDGLVLLIFAPRTPRLDPGDGLHHVLHEVLADRLRAADARDAHAGSG
eukprot:26343-Pelagococcus_subviridis.AAC.3